MKSKMESGRWCWMSASGRNTAAGIFLGRKLIPLNELSARMKELPKDREIVCVCASGNRSSSATRALTSAGYNAINMKGGMSAWRRANLAVKKGDA